MPSDLPIRSDFNFKNQFDTKTDFDADRLKMPAAILDTFDISSQKLTAGPGITSLTQVSNFSLSTGFNFPNKVAGGAPNPANIKGGAANNTVHRVAVTNTGNDGFRNPNLSQQNVRISGNGTAVLNGPGMPSGTQTALQTLQFAKKVLDYKIGGVPVKMGGPAAMVVGYLASKGLEYGIEKLTTNNFVGSKMPDTRVEGYPADLQPLGPLEGGLIDDPTVRAFKTGNEGFGIIDPRLSSGHLDGRLNGEELSLDTIPPGTASADTNNIGNYVYLSEDGGESTRNPGTPRGRNVDDSQGSSLLEQLIAKSDAINKLGPSEWSRHADRLASDAERQQSGLLEELIRRTDIERRGGINAIIQATEDATTPPPKSAVQTYLDAVQRGRAHQKQLREDVTRKSNAIDETIRLVNNKDLIKVDKHGKFPSGAKPEYARDADGSLHIWDVNKEHGRLLTKLETQLHEYRDALAKKRNHDIDMAHHEEIISKHDWELTRYKLTARLAKLESEYSTLKSRYGLGEGTPDADAIKLIRRDYSRQDADRLVEIAQELKDIESKNNRFVNDLIKITLSKNDISLFEGAEKEVNRVLQQHKRNRVDIEPLREDGYNLTSLDIDRMEASTSDVGDSFSKLLKRDVNSSRFTNNNGD